MELNRVYLGDCIDIIKTFPDNSVDAICCDPPYELGFMGKSWDNSGIAYNVEMWKECLRVLKPGGHLLSFGGTRTYHRITCAIEDAGFEIRDMIEFCYGSGFPKSLNVWKQLKKNCTCGNMEVYEKRIQLQRTLGEAETEYEMRLMQETDLSQTKINKDKQGKVLQSGLSEQSPQSGGRLSKQIPLSKSRKESSMEGRLNLQETEGQLQGSNLSEMPEGISTNGKKRRLHNATQISDGSTPEQTSNENGGSASRRPQSEQQQYREPCSFCKQYGTQAIRTLGVGTALKPAHEPICMARKPLAEKTVAENVLKYGTGGINIDESRVSGIDTRQKTGGAIEGSGWGTKGGAIAGSELGRFPANLIHDNSEEVRECFPDKGERFFKSIIYQAKASKSERNKGLENFEEVEVRGGGGRVEEGYDLSDPEQVGLKEAARKYGAVKAKKANIHPTVKPIALMEYLIKMITPKGGVVLDPFAGSGSTLIAAKQNGFQYIGIELTEEYIPIIEARLKAVIQPQLKL